MRLTHKPIRDSKVTQFHNYYMTIISTQKEQLKKEDIIESTAQIN